MNRLQLFIILLLVTLLMFACSKNDEENVEDNQNESSQSEQTTYYPFTGIETNENVQNRAIAVMVNNHPNARPHSGLSQADLIFELLAEGDITRFLALYHSEQPDIIGSVRSAREYYFNLADGYDAVYVYHGAAQFINDLINSNNIEHLNGALYDNDNYLFRRESFRQAPHNSYLLFENVYEEIQAKGYDVQFTYEPLPFLSDDTQLEELELVNNIQIDYGTSTQQVVTYQYDETKDTYQRRHNNDLTIELSTEELVEIDNIFVVETYHEVIDDEGRREIDLISGGNAYLFQKGSVQEVEWKNENGRIIPMKEGEIIGFKPGKTWINFIPTQPGLNQAVTYE